jgi:glycerol-3-phosphate acyltransferase PlsY
MYLLLLIAAVAGYFLGALPFGYLVARAYGVDIFKEGSGNPGATNVKRVLGTKAGGIVYVLDACKGAIAAGWPLLYFQWRHLSITRVTTNDAGRALGTIDWCLACAVIGMVAAVVGHSFSVFTRFKGGKGVATASGGLLVVIPVPALIGIIVWFVTFFASRYVSLASIMAAAVTPAATWVLGRPLGLNLMVTLVGLLVIVRHHGNIRRLFAGTEHRWVRGEPPAVDDP